MECPKTLFKYGKFKNYSLDMIDNDYIYFCPANKLDDQFECFNDWNKYKDMQVKILVEIIKDILGNFGIDIPDLAFNEFYDEKALNKDKAFEYFKSNVMSSEQAICLIEIIKFFENIESIPVLKESIQRTVLMQDYLGVCSLSEENTNQVMWTMYANNYNGYCIEYDIETALHENPKLCNDLFKVKYSENRENDIIKEILKMFYGKILSEFMNNLNLYSADDLKEMLINIATTKHPDWASQKEWRFIGKPDGKMYLPIKAVYLGGNASLTNRNKMISKCKKKRIPLYVQKNSYETLKIVFERIDVN